MKNPIAVIGAGSWGTALAIHLSHAQSVNLWCRDEAQAKAMRKARENIRYLPGMAFSDDIQIFSEFKQTLESINDVLVVVPSHAFRETLIQLKPYLHEHSRLIWATKGLDPASNQLLHVVAEEILGKNIPLAVLSGPTFAKEVAVGLPTAVTIASHSKDFVQELIARFHHKHFRVYYSKDIIGVELGGAVKNVLAIAAGIADGLNCGANAIAALITRGLHEMMRLGVALGGLPETFMGLAGLGDLVLTCTNNQSRNRRFGFAMGQGKTKAEAEKSIDQVVEGIITTKEIYQLAQQLKIDMPITTQVYKVLYQELSPTIAVQNLLEREPKAES